MLRLLIWFKLTPLKIILSMVLITSLSSFILHAAQSSSTPKFTEIQRLLEQGGKIKGSKKTLANGVPLYQIVVDKQPSVESYCGYYAVKNILAAEKFVANPTSETLNVFTGKTGKTFYAESVQKFEAVKAKLLEIKDNEDSKKALLAYQQELETRLGDQKDRVKLKQDAKSKEVRLFIDKMNVVTAFEENKSGDHKGVMYPNFLPVMLDQSQLSFVLALAWRDNYFTQALNSSGDIDILPFRIFKMINDVEGDFLGIAFSQRYKHWISMALAKVEGKKIVFCFDSLGGNQINNPTVQFIAKSFAGGTFMKDYFELVVPAVVAFLKAKNLEKDIDKLREFLLFAGSQQKGQKCLLDLFVGTIGDTKAWDILKEILEEKKLLVEFYNVMDTLVVRFYGDSAGLEVFLDEKFRGEIKDVVITFCNENSEVMQIPEFTAYSSEPLKSAIETLFSNGIPSERSKEDLFRLMPDRKPEDYFVQTWLTKFKADLKSKSKLNTFEQAVEKKIKEAVDKRLIFDVKKIRDFLYTQLPPLEKLKIKLVKLRGVLVVLKNKLVTLSERLAELKKKLGDLRTKVGAPTT